MLDDLAKSRRVSERVEANGRGDLDSMTFEQRPERADDLLDQAAQVDRADRRRLVRHDPDRGEDRVDEAVEALDLLERGLVPCGAGLAPLDVARFAADEIWLIGQEVGVRANHREGRAQLMGDERDQLAARLVDRLERLDACLGLGLLAALLDDALPAGRRSRRAGPRHRP